MLERIRGAYRGVAVDGAERVVADDRDRIAMFRRVNEEVAQLGCQGVRVESAAYLDGIVPRGSVPHRATAEGQRTMRRRRRGANAVRFRSHQSRRAVRVADHSGELYSRLV